ncbi:MAG: hypothetical protein ACODAE_03190 [Gemmatimonadota bacterium]
MVSRSPTGRIQTLLLTVLFLGAVGGGWGVHDCPHHDIEPSSSASDAHAESDVHAGAAWQGGAAAAPSAATGHGSDHDQGHDGRPCTCVGACNGGASAPVVASVASAARPPVGLVRTRSVPVTAEPRGLHDAYLLPFANGPPTG